MQWVGMQRLLTDMDLTSDAVMAVGDGGNDYELVLNCGLGIAMANAVPKASTLIAEQPMITTLTMCRMSACAILPCRRTIGSCGACACRCWTLPTMSRRPTTKMASQRFSSVSCCDLSLGTAADQQRYWLRSRYRQCVIQIRLWAGRYRMLWRY